MYIVKRKYIIKIISFFIGFISIIAGMFLQRRYIAEQDKKQDENAALSILTNICASLEKIDTSFKKANDLETFQEENKVIYANASAIHILFSLCEENTEKSVSWFAKLCEYSKTDMSDSEKNQYYSSKIHDAKNLFISICQKNRTKNAVSQIEDYFDDETSYDYENILFNIEKQYSFLNNRINADRKDIAEYARSILGRSFITNQFKGNYIFPKAVSYSSDDAYANIFPSGKTLLIMSEEDNSSAKNSTLDEYSKIAEKELEKYASYAVDFKLAHTINKENLIYFIFCPIIEKENIFIINYDEAIKLAISANTGKLKAFDATKYLKNHPSIPDDSIPLQTDTSMRSDSYTQIAVNAIIFNNKFFIESLIQTHQGNKYYHLYNESTQENLFYTEDEYITMLGQI